MSVGKWLDAKFGRIFSRGTALELEGGINFEPPLIATRNADAGRIDVGLPDLAAEIDALVNEITGTPVSAAHTSTGASYETIAALDYAIPEDSTVHVVFEAIGRVGAKHGVYRIDAQYTRNASGAGDAVEDWQVAFGGAPSEMHGDIVWDARVLLDGNTLHFQVKANSDDPAWDLERVANVKGLP